VKPVTVTMNRDDDFDPRSRTWLHSVLLDAVEQVRFRLSENVTLIKAADPDGTLHELATVLALKRGCRRSSIDNTPM
jgi:hypothetical protein